MLSCRFIDTIKPEPGSEELPRVHQASSAGSSHRPRSHPAPSDQQRHLSDLISTWNSLSAFMSPKMIPNTVPNTPSEPNLCVFMWCCCIV